MGFWQTGYREFKEDMYLGGESGPEGVSWPAPSPYVCDICGQKLPELEALRRHRFERHPVRQPLLLLSGRAVGSLPVQLMTPLRMHDVVVEDATLCTVNCQPIALRDLGTHLATMRREYAEIELTNNGAATRCVLDFRIAEEEHLAGVEQAFGRMAHDRELNLDALSRFTKECRAFASAMPYCDGICHYLYGVMAKERASDSGLRPDQYTERYLRASDELAGFDRPLARAVRAVVAFHFNHFDDAEALASDGALRQTAGAFAGLLQGLPWHFDAAYSPESGGAVEDLLTDQHTLQIVDDASRGLLYLKLHAEELLAGIRRMTSGYDRLKRQLLAGEAFAARDDDAARAQARMLARELVAQEAAGPWAAALLEKTKRP